MKDETAGRLIRILAGDLTELKNRVEQVFIESSKSQTSDMVIVRDNFEKLIKYLENTSHWLE